MRPISIRRPTAPGSASLPEGLTPSEAEELSRSRHVARYSPAIVRELPPECLLAIDVNGMHAGTVQAVPDACRELAAGWAFMHGFFDVPGELDRVTVTGDRASVMVEGGDDLDLHRMGAVGWQEPSSLRMSDATDEAGFQIGEPALLDLVDATWHAFRRDGGGEGYLHAAVTSAEDIHCIARDRTLDMAAAKVLGWMLLDGQTRESQVLLVRGIVGRRIVEAASRLGVSLIVTSAIPTADAFRAATGLCMSLVGMAGSRTMGLMVDGGHIEWESTEDASMSLRDVLNGQSGPTG